MKNDKPFEVVDTKIPYKNPWMQIREDKITRQNGNEGIYGFMEVAESVCVVAVDDKDRICLVESYRHPFDGWFWELPGGGGEGEDLISASKKELKEETGIVAKEWIRLGRARVCNGLSTEYQSNVLALNLEVSNSIQTEDETRARKFVTLNELDEMINNGDFADNQSITALYMYKNWLKQNVR